MAAIKTTELAVHSPQTHSIIYPTPDLQNFPYVVAESQFCHNQVEWTKHRPPASDTSGHHPEF